MEMRGLAIREDKETLHDCTAWQVERKIRHDQRAISKADKTHRLTIYTRAMQPTLEGHRCLFIKPSRVFAEVVQQNNVTFQNLQFILIFYYKNNFLTCDY